MSHIRQGYQRRLSWSEAQQKDHALSQLKAFKRLMVENKTAIFQAVKADFNKVIYAHVHVHCTELHSIHVDWFIRQTITLSM